MQRDVVEIRRKVAGLVVAAALVGGVLFGIGLRSWSDHKVFGAQAVDVKVAKDFAPVNLGNFANGFSAVIKPALPAVVNISSSKVVKTHNQLSPFMQDPFFRQFFGDQFGNQPQTQKEQSLGSGVVVNPNGYILTNNHVVEGATDIKVDLNLPEKKEYQAKVIGTDSQTDIAVLKINATNLPALTLGDSSKLQVGDVVFAVGDPFGIGETATMGIVSATGRTNLNIEGYENFIQTDAAINPGNSGGALLDVRGNLVGINTAILTGGGGGNQGIGFAIPIDEARHVMDQLVEHGRVSRGYLGVYIEQITPALAKQFGLNQEGGALIGDVSAGGPGAKAGLKRGDAIVELNGQPVADSTSLRFAIASMAPGTTVDLKLIRDGKPMDVKVTLGELPEKTESNQESGENRNGPSTLKGVEVQNLTPDIAQELNLPAGTHGVVVSQVDPSSAAGEAGLQRGDVIQEVNHKPVNSTDEYESAIRAAGSQPVLLLVNRGGITTYVAIQSND
jgi:serine protease Do